LPTHQKGKNVMNSINNIKKIQDVSDAEWQAEMGQFLNNSDRLSTQEKVVKTQGAQKVLSLMDFFEDGDDRYCEFVKLVSTETGITIEQLNKELEPFI
jgi:hypothetical protein